MKAVTTRYWWTRRYNVRGLLGWSAQNEIRLYGYLTVYRPWEMTPSYSFCISRWLYPDGGTDYISRYGLFDEPMPRYSELLDFPLNVWDHVRHPWEDEPCTPIECFHTKKERRRYLDCRLYDVYERMLTKKDIDSALVMHLPYGGLPLVSVESTAGKVTIY